MYMEKENWIERVKRRRNEKKIAKLRTQFGFLIKEYNDSVKEISNIFEMRINALGSDLHTGKSSVEELLSEISRKIDEINTENINAYENMKNTFSEIVTSGNEKMSHSAEDIKSTFDKKCSKIQETISQSQIKTDREYQDIIKVLQNISSQLELVQGSINGVSDTTKTIVDEKTASIVLSIDEVKTLMKVVAVNNLLDEI